MNSSAAQKPSSSGRKDKQKQQPQQHSSKAQQRQVQVHHRAIAPTSKICYVCCNSDSSHCMLVAPPSEHDWIPIWIKPRFAFDLIMVGCRCSQQSAIAVFACKWQLLQSGRCAVHHHPMHVNASSFQAFLPLFFGCGVVSSPGMPAVCCSRACISFG